MGQLSINELMRGMRHEKTIAPRRAADPRRAAAPRRAAPPRGAPFLNLGPPRGGMGALAGSKKKKKRQRAALHARLLAEVRGLQAKMEAELNKLSRVAQQARDVAYQAESLASSAGDERSYGLIQGMQETVFALQESTDKANQAFQEFENEFNSARSRGGNYATPALVGVAESAVRMIGSEASRAARVASQLGSALSRIQSSAQKVAQASAAAGAALAAQQRDADARAARSADIEERRYQDQLRREEQQRQREDEARAREREYQSQLRQEESDAREREDQREEDARQRREDADQRRIDAEFNRENAALMAEQRRFAMEQEKVLRAEERELRREDREAELQRLVLMQEMAAKGIPVDFGPASSSSMAPQAPAAAFPGFPGMPQPFVPAGSGQVPGLTMPLVPMAPGAPATNALFPYPGAPPRIGQHGAPAQPGSAPWQQGSAPQFQPQQGMFADMRQRGAAQAPPPGEQWSSFDPANELFGMGALIPASNPALRGARIEQGYILTGTGDGPYRLIFTADGGGVTFQGKSSWSYDELFAGAIADPKNKGKIVFEPPSVNPRTANDAAFNREIAKGIFQVTGDIAKAAGGWAAARENRRGRGQGYGSQYGVQYGGQYGGQYGSQYGSQYSRGPSPIFVVGALGAAAVLVGLAVKGGKKKKKGKKE